MNRIKMKNNNFYNYVEQILPKNKFSLIYIAKLNKKRVFN